MSTRALARNLFIKFCKARVRAYRLEGGRVRAGLGELSHPSLPSHQAGVSITAREGDGVRAGLGGGVLDLPSIHQEPDLLETS